VEGGMANKKTVVTDELVENSGLTKQEYEKIKELIGREPNYTELGMFSAMWSEHCSYKTSKPVLKKFFTSGSHVIQGPGENAGIVDIGDGLAVVFKIESHNHPSAIEPYEASATGGGGCIRDISVMGAEPIALLDSLRLGRIENEKVQYLLKEIARGFTDYANMVEVPVVGGEIYFDESYEGNPLVNAMTIGIVKHENIVKARASGVGNLVLIIGGATGRDGVEGAAFASSSLDEKAEVKSSAVAIGDPAMGKILRKAVLELVQKKLVIGIQDMGAAGLTCSTSETAYKAGTGVEIDISLVPRKEEGMNAYEIMLSESQERMLIIIDKNKLEDVKETLNKWNVPLSIIGKVTGDRMVRVKEGGNIVAEVPASALAEAPVYHKEDSKPEYIDKISALDLSSINEPDDYNETLLKLLSHPTIASKKWVYEKGDPKLNENLCVTPGYDAGVYYIKKSKKAIAATVDCNGTYCYLNAFTGGKIAVAEAARNLVCMGATPLAVTDGLNFGNPNNPEIFWQFKQAVSGISEACQTFNTPVISGNVSFNNENPRGSIDPTPIVGMVGLIEDVSKIITQDFKNAGDMIFLIGENKEELGGSQYLMHIHGLKKGKCPDLDLNKEKTLHDSILEIINQDLISSAHDCSEGGLAISLAESCLVKISQKLGANVTLPEYDIRKDAQLFGETQSRIIVSANSENENKIKSICKKHGVPCYKIGKVTKESKLKIDNFVDLNLEKLDKAWSRTIKNFMEK